MSTQKSKPFPINLLSHQKKAGTRRLIRKGLREICSIMSKENTYICREIKVRMNASCLEHQIWAASRKKTRSSISGNSEEHTQEPYCYFVYISGDEEVGVESQRKTLWCLQTLNRYSINTNGTGKKREKHITKIAVQWLRLNRKQ